ncbi:hypothetical protein G6O69_34265 [Pseudenhygromyxa sp. WMMC2535]|uniref:hypothetical protein n=1 Tax=Pseudenhygromyxa sp. WMMC2535 TaxID=2712867 RepID=UPI001557EBC0|nr:hypothetical protein [Pseudenhygromyxa sp. WMMC2535]NVB42937.1 hypothetical protein [Pseudenhygromyxa sp. WMMC2535]
MPFVRLTWSSGLTATVALLSALSLACKGDTSADDDTSDAGTTTGEEGEEEATEESAGDESDTSDSSDVGDDGPTTGGECTFWVPDDCNDPNLKCMPWSEKADRIPDEARCCSLDPSPVSLGERCEVEDYDGSCLDNCPEDSLCVIDDVDGLEGFCQTYCEPGNSDSCPPNEICKAFFEMIEAAETVPVCMARCDPLLQDCESYGRPGWSCLPEGSLSPSFLCMPPAEDPSLEGQSCLLQNDCEVGLTCIPASSVDQEYYPECGSAIFCCSRYCDLTEPNICGGSHICVDLESDVPGLENVGICALPP